MNKIIKRPIKSDFIVCNQFEFDESLNKYHKELEVYATNLERNTNQRIIEELEKQMELSEVGNSYTRLRDRIYELKQE